ncbi:putative teichuronic acid biosynthesis glycosyltransferase TuaH [Petrocella atlantisensis]|uniref:Putative teichuronic acid biosynthesis glycosyltransferase TuaH n=1 Tax=Petrocella atlantisensis TaxID=2173034 RepID=A0A3P7NY05_9FIRM|nr:glycosyltransferase family 4 protein [Petrocella atlantisensis]MCF8018796.1 glycosyltransferase family 4 protein [Vallitaleaceae bacterium]VDN46170.1 putative teichuronic acid biosynthesis glycosyltransferase TuaH [Petrocella atlantisensis]
MTDHTDKKIWILHHTATPPSLNGFTRPYDFALNLQPLGYEVEVFAASHLHYANYNLIDDRRLFLTKKEKGVGFTFVKTLSSSDNGIKRIMNMLDYYRNVLKVIKRMSKQGNKPNLIIASSPHPLAMLAGIKASKKLKVPCICEVRDFWPEVFFIGGRLKEKSLIGRLLVKGEYWIYKHADAMIFLKEGDYTYLTDKKWDIEQGGQVDLKKCHYINNGVDLKAFDRRMKEDIIDDPDLEGDHFKVIYAGAIRPVNNVDNILDAAEHLLDHKAIRFYIYGDGNQLDRLKKRAVDEGLTNVVFKGYIEKQYIPYVLSKASVNILNYSQSMYNWSRGNSSNKLFEYMASGKPIISTVKMGYSLIDRYDCGLSLDEDRPENLAKAVLQLYELPKEAYDQMGHNGRMGVRDFDYKALTNKLVSVIESL